MISVILFIHIILCIAIIALILLQQGKGANMGAAFGSGASGTVFGSRGPAGFLMKLTAGLVTLFFVTSISLGYMAATQAKAQQTLSKSTASRQSLPGLTTDTATAKQTIPAAPK